VDERYSPHTVPYDASVRVLGFRWVGVRTDQVAEMRRFALDVLGLHLGDNDSEGFVELVTADGSRLELFGYGEDTPGQFAANEVVAGLLVDDIGIACQELRNTAGVELLGDLETRAGGYSWQQFRAPDGHVYELILDPASRSGGTV
jgi:hypothetical protein